jgi:hypothetical protein
MKTRWFEQFILQSPEGGSEGGGGAGAGGGTGAGAGASQVATDPAAGAGDGEGTGDDDLSRVKHALDRERTANRDKDRRLGALEAQLRELTTTNPEAVREAQAKAQQEQARRELIEQQAALERQQIEAKYSQQLEESTTALQAEREARQRELVRQLAEKAFIGAKGSTEVSEIDGSTPFDSVWSRFGPQFRNEDGALVVVDANGSPEIDPETGKRFEPVKWLRRLQSDPVWGRNFEPAMGTGGGARSSRDGRVSNSKDLMAVPLSTAIADVFG